MPQKLSETKPNPIALCLVGNAGAGKSTVASMFPRPYFLDLDKNLAGPKKVWNKVFNKECPVLFDHIDTDKTGKALDIKLQYGRFSELLLDAVRGDFCDTIIIDSTTLLNDVMQAEVLRQSPTKTGNMEIPSWGLYLNLWKLLLGKLRQSNKNIIFIAHETIQKNELDQVLRHAIALPGQIGELLPTMFTDVWRCFVDEKPNDKGQLVNKRMIRTMQSERFPNLKTSLDAKGMFEVTPENIQAIINSNK